MPQEFQTDDPVTSFPPVWRRVVTEPRAFFHDMPLTGGLPAPLAFLAICLAICGLGFLLIGPRGWSLRIVIEGVLRAFVYAALLTIVARQLFAGVADFEGNFRVVAYAAAPFVVYWIPVVGQLAALYAAYLVIVGLERVNAFDAVKAVLTLLLTAGVVLVLARILGLAPPWAI
jgi:hypothetical protein